MLEVFEPGALNYTTFFRAILSTLSAFRNPILTPLPLSGFLDSLLCVLIVPTPGLAFSLLIPRTLAAALSFSPSPSLGLKSYFRPPRERSIRLGHLLWSLSSQWPWHTHSSPSLLWQSLLTWHFLCPLFSCPFLLLEGASGPGFWPPPNSSIYPSLSGLSPQRAPPLSSIFRKLAGMGLPPTLTLTVLQQRNTRLFPLLLLSLPLWHWMWPNLPFFLAASNALLKLSGLLRWKVRLVKDARLSLPLTEVMKIARLTSPPLDAPRQSSPRWRHGRRLALLFHLNLTLNLYTLFFALSLAHPPRLPPLLTFLTVLLPGNRLRSMPLTCDPTFPFLSQRLCVAEPEATPLSSAESRALWSLTRPFALLSLSLNFLRLPPTFLLTPPLAQTKLPILCWCTFLAQAWIFFLTSSIFPGLRIPFLPFGRHFSLFPYTRWESLSTLLLPSGLSLSPPAYQSCLNAFFYPFYSSFWNLIPFSLPARPVSALDGLHLIKFCTFLSSFRMGLTNPGRALGRSCLLSISRKLLTLSGISPFSTNLFRLASLLALLVRLNLFFLIGALVWFIKITKVISFESVEVFRKDPFLDLYFSLSSLMIFRPLCLLPSAAFFTLTIWPFDPPLPRSPLQWRPHKELCFDWSTGLSTGVFLSIRANVRHAFFSVDPHQANLQPNLLLLGSRLRFNPTPTFLGVTFNRTLFFSKHVSSLKIKFFPRLKALRCICASSWAPPRSPSLFCTNLFFGPFSHTLHPGGFLS